MFGLIPWKRKEKDRELTPYRAHPLATIRDEFDALFDRFLSRWAGTSDWDFGPSWGMDVLDKDEEVVVRAEAPGFEPGDLDVQVSGNLLTIKGDRHSEREEGNGYYHEKRYSSFRRTVNLPAGTDPDRIEARYKNGVLEVHVPKSEKARAKRIPVKA